jgi:hypothetical protein
VAAVDGIDECTDSDCSPERPQADIGAMRTRWISLAASVFALTFGGCTASPGSATDASVADGEFGIDCPGCFLMIECMRSGLGEDLRQQGMVTCDRCCETLTFTTVEQQIFVSTKRMPQPMPIQVCAPVPPR